MGWTNLNLDLGTLIRIRQQIDHYKQQQNFSYKIMGVWVGKIYI